MYALNRTYSLVLYSYVRVHTFFRNQKNVLFFLSRPQHPLLASEFVHSWAHQPLFSCRIFFTYTYIVYDIHFTLSRAHIHTKTKASNNRSETSRCVPNTYSYWCSCVNMNNTKSKLNKLNHACITYIWLLHLNISVRIFIVPSKCLRWLYKLLPILSHPQQHGLITNFIFTTHLWLKFFPLRGGKQPPLCTYDIILTYVPLVGFRMLCTYTHYFWQICNFYVPLKHQ